MVTTICMAARIRALVVLLTLTLLAAAPVQGRSTRLPIKGFRAAEVVAPSRIVRVVVTVASPTSSLLRVTTRSPVVPGRLTVPVVDPSS